MQYIVTYHLYGHWTADVNDVRSFPWWINWWIEKVWDSEWFP